MTDIEKEESKETLPSHKDPRIDSTTTDTSTAIAASPHASKRRSLAARIFLPPARPEVTHSLAHQRTGPESIVDFDGDDDPYKPLNWPLSRKMTTLAVYALTALASAFNSAIFSSGTTQIAEEFHVSTIVGNLGTSLTLVGFALGPLIWGPLSELYGRKNVILVPVFIAACFAFGCGAAENIQTILVCRFFQGAFSVTVIVCAGGVLADIFAPKQRGTAFIVYTLCVVGGPMVSPIVGSAIVQSSLGWRWTMYIVGILQTFTAVLGLITLEETYAPVVLAQKARQLRIETGNWSLHAKHEEWTPSFKGLATKYFIRPFTLLGNPICFLMCFYASFVYGLIYGSLSAVPIIFTRRGWGPITSSLPFLALLLGALAGLLGNLPLQKLYANAVDKNNGKPVPEARLYAMMYGCFCLTMGLFILAWTGTLKVVWVVPCIGIFLIGAGFFPIFQGSLNYVVDSYLSMAASAVSALTCTRSVFAAAFPLFTEPMLNSLGIPWGVSLLGFISVILLPVPFIFFFFGERIRTRTRTRTPSAKNGA